MIVYDEDGQRVTTATYSTFIEMCRSAAAEGDCWVEIGGEPLAPIEVFEALQGMGVPAVFNPDLPEGAWIYTGQLQIPE